MERGTRSPVVRLLRAPELAVGAVVALAVGIGAPTTIGSVLIRVATGPGPGRLVALERVGADSDLYRDRTASFEALTFYRVAKGTARVTADYFDVAPPPTLGRALSDSDETDVAVLSFRRWQDTYGADPGIIGRSVDLDGAAVQIVGVMPEGFEAPTAVDQWMALTTDSADEGPMAGLGRLAAGVSLEQARTEIETLALDRNRLPPRVVAIEDGVEDAEWFALGAVGFLLLVGGPVVANLLLARAEATRREAEALAPVLDRPPRTAQHVFGELILVSLAGSVLGVMLAFVGLESLTELSLPGAREASVSLPVLAVTLASSWFVCLGLGACVSAYRRDDRQTVKSPR